MLIQTPLHYVKLFYSTGVIFASDTLYDEKSKKTVRMDNCIKQKSKVFKDCLRDVRMYCDYFADFSTLDYRLLQYKEEIIAMACVLCARKICKIKPEFPKNFEVLYDITFEETQQPFERLWKFYHD